MTHSQPSPQNDALAGGPVAMALGRIPSGLYIVTWREPHGSAEQHEPSDRGMLASWIMQGGFSPPLVTVAVGTSRDLLAAIDQCAPFVINVLGESQRGIVARFGKPPTAGEDPFAGLSIARTPAGNAALAEAVAWLECRPVSQTGGGGGATGDHVIILARVDAAGVGSEQPPLVHTRRNGLRY